MSEHNYFSVNLSGFHQSDKQDLFLRWNNECFDHKTNRKSCCLFNNTLKKNTNRSQFLFAREEKRSDSLVKHETTIYLTVKLLENNIHQKAMRAQLWVYEYFSECGPVIRTNYVKNVNILFCVRAFYVW